MREDVPSLTAVYVAFMRALASQDRELSQACSDPSALALLPRALRPLVEGARGSALAGNIARRVTFGLEDHIALRTGLIDAALEHAMVDHHDHPERPSVEQVVLLGAGFDARAHRLKSLSRLSLIHI